MDLDIEMDVDDVQDVPQIPEAYTHDIITGEEQVRTHLPIAMHPVGSVAYNSYCPVCLGTRRSRR